MAASPAPRPSPQPPRFRPKRARRSTPAGLFPAPLPFQASGLEAAGLAPGTQNRWKGQTSPGARAGRGGGGGGEQGPAEPSPAGLAGANPAPCIAHAPSAHAWLWSTRTRHTEPGVGQRRRPPAPRQAAGAPRTLTPGLEYVCLRVCAPKGSGLRRRSDGGRGGTQSLGAPLPLHGVPQLC